MQLCWWQRHFGTISLSTRWRQRLPKLSLSVSVQDVTKESKAVGDPCQSEDGEDECTSLSDPSDEQSTGKTEAAEGKQEATVARPQRRASTPPPPNLPVKILTRLGSLDGEFTGVTLM